MRLTDSCEPMLAVAIENKNYKYCLVMIERKLSITLVGANDLDKKHHDGYSSVTFFNDSNEKRNGGRSSVTLFNDSGEKRHGGRSSLPFPTQISVKTPLGK
jgi:hypothetical protein